MKDIQDMIDQEEKQEHEIKSARSKGRRRALSPNEVEIELMDKESKKTRSRRKDESGNIEDDEEKDIEEDEISPPRSTYARKIMPPPAIYDQSLQFDKSIAGNSSGFNYGWARHGDKNNAGRLSMSGYNFAMAQAASGLRSTPVGEASPTPKGAIDMSRAKIKKQDPDRLYADRKKSREQRLRDSLNKQRLHETREAIVVHRGRDRTPRIYMGNDDTSGSP